MQKFSNFSLNLFLLLFGFFCGNLLPGGSIEFPWDSASVATRWTLPLELNPEEIQSPSAKLSLAQPLEKSRSNNIFSEIFFTPQHSWVDSANQICSKAIPGPGFLGFLVVILAEFINWCEMVSKQIPPQLRSKEKKPKFILKTRVSSFYLGNSSKFGYLNSFKIGLLLGIFVDAFKVGS